MSEVTKTKKKSGFILITGAALLMAFAGTALAHGGRGGKGDGGAPTAEEKAQHEQRRAEMTAKYDTNKDGKLDDAERAKLHADMAKERFTRLDANGDGVLSLDEFSADRGHHGPPRQK
jgi:hypothetical protein